MGVVPAGSELAATTSFSASACATRKPADPFESLKTRRVLAIPEKNGKTEYEVDAQNPEQTVNCVHSLFPHSGYSPCWYIKLRIDQPIPV